MTDSNHLDEKAMVALLRADQQADGHIEIQEVYTVGQEFETKLIRRLTDKEAIVIRANFMKENGQL